MAKLVYELENKGSVARDHLALERTFLAWLRTSLGLVGIGIAIAQLFRLPGLVSEEKPGSAQWLQKHPNKGSRIESLQRIGTPLGVSFIAVGIAILLTGCHRFFFVQAKLVHGVFVPSRIEMIGLSGVTLALLAATVGVLIAVSKGSL